MQPAHDGWVPVVLHRRHDVVDLLFFLVLRQVYDRHLLVLYAACLGQKGATVVNNCLFGPRAVATIPLKELCLWSRVSVLPAQARNWCNPGAPAVAALLA
jgi:hypothetical protein